MKRKLSMLCCAVVILCLPLGLLIGLKGYCKATAQAVCGGAQGQIQKNLESTLNLLEAIAQESWMLPESIPYREKAARLDVYNEIWGYRMIRVVDSAGGVYRADHDTAVSNLNSREYIQTLWVTGEPQITDAFLAGADGTTLNYTVAVAIAGDAQANGALFAAIDDNEVRAILQKQSRQTVLLGKKQQFMSGGDESLLGVTLETKLKKSTPMSRNLENTLLWVKNENSGTFWCWEGIMPSCYAFSAMGLDSGWTVLTSVSFADAAGDLAAAVLIVAFATAIAVAALVLIWKTKDRNASK